MSFYSKLRAELEGKLSEKEIELLPRSYLVLGKLMLIRLKPKLLKHRKLIGKEIKELFPYIDAVFLEKSIEGVTRKPKVELIAGGKRHSGPVTQTVHNEYGCKFMLDVSEVMWSKGNKEEKQRINRLVKKGEIVVDMFAGIGYFSIFIAKKSSPKMVYSIEINPKAAEFLEKNTWLNNVEQKITILRGDCRDYADMLENRADRILMGYLHNTENYFIAALKICKNNAIIHFHRKLKQNEVEKMKKELDKLAKKENAKLKFLKIVQVKSYAPHVWHYVFDIKVRKLIDL